jgi:hypothetical protein
VVLTIWKMRGKSLGSHAIRVRYEVTVDMLLVAHSALGTSQTAEMLSTMLRNM